MKQIIKKLGAIIACVVLSSVSLNTVALADVADSTMRFDTLDDYVEFCVPRHLSAQHIEVGEVLEYSDPISLYNFESNTIIGSEIFLIKDGVLIGKMDIFEDNDSYTSYLDTTISDEIAGAYSNGDQIAIGGFNQSLLLYTEPKGFSLVDGLESGEPKNIPSKLAKISVRGSISTNSVMPYSIAEIDLPVPHVKNSTTYNELGQCWASCVAMKINYHFNRSLTSDMIYEALYDADVDFSKGGTQLALAHFGYKNYVRTGSAMRPGDVATQLKNQKPVIMHISNESGSSTHAVIIRGISLDTASSTYLIDDPNYNSVRSLVHTTNIGLPGSTIAQYTSLGYGFTKWYNAFY